MRGPFSRSAVAFGLLAAAGCHRAAATHAGWQPRFGPVINNELIVGRVADGGSVWLLTGNSALVRVDLAARRFVRHAVRPLVPGEMVWGLAAGADETMWTLVGRRTLGQMGRDGAIVRRIELKEPHVGLFGTGSALVYQRVNLEPPADALHTGPPGEHDRRPWSRIRTRELPFARGAVAALNLVSCGPTLGGPTPCWFPDQPVVTLVDRSGESRDLALEGLPAVSPEVLLAAEHPRRPIRDAFTTGDYLWVVGSGAGTDAAETRPGGWLLARYGHDGRLLDRRTLPAPARLILTAGADSAVLLAWDGTVVEVRL